MSTEPVAVVVPKELFYHEVAYVRGLETEVERLRSELEAVKREVSTEPVEVNKELKQMLNALKIERDALKEAVKTWKDSAVEAKKELEQVKREAVEVLKPWSDFADALNENVPDDIAIGIFADGAMRFGPSGGANVGHLRAARAFVEKHGRPHDGK